MNTFKDVQSNQPWKPEPAKRYNAVNELLRNHGKNGGGFARTAMRSPGRVLVYNSGKEKIEASRAVMLTGNVIRENNQTCFEIELWTDDGSEPVLALTETAVDAEDIGTAIVAGAAKAEIAEGTGEWAEVGEGGKLVCSDNGNIRVLAFGSGTDPAIVLLGATRKKAYDGPYAVKLYQDDDGNPKLRVNAGWALVNGQFFNVPAKHDITPENAYLCVYADVDMESTNIPAPEIVFGAPDANHYPIAAIMSTAINEETGDPTGWEIEQYYSQVAVFQIVKPCPLAEL